MGTHYKFAKCPTCDGRKGAQVKSDDRAAMDAVVGLKVTQAWFMCPDCSGTGMSPIRFRTTSD